MYNNFLLMKIKLLVFENNSCYKTNISNLLDIAFKTNHYKELKK